MPPTSFSLASVLTLKSLERERALCHSENPAGQVGLKSHPIGGRIDAMTYFGHFAKTGSLAQ